MPWNISGQVEPHSRSGVDAHGWLWEIERDGEERRVLVEVAGTVWAIHGVGGQLFEQVRQAIETEGLSEVERVVEMDEPPRVISVTTNGAIDRAPDE